MTSDLTSVGLLQHPPGFLPPHADVAVAGPLGGLPDDRLAQERYPQLREFRARLGNTPLIELPNPDGGARILAKVESGNPFGSIKDRPAYGVLCGAVADHGDSDTPLRIVDYSGGNMALALGGLGHLTGIPMRLAMPSSTPASILRQLERFGTQVEFVPAENFLIGILQRALRLAVEEPGARILLQHRNVRNLAMHEFTTGRELLDQLGTTAPRYWIAPIGTGGTLAGVTRALRRRFPDVAVVGVSPREMPYGVPGPPGPGRKFPGAGGFGFGLEQPFVQRFVPDALHRSVSYERAVATMRAFRDLTGTAIGASAAADWLVAREFAATLGPDETIVTIVPDAGTAEDWQAAEELGS